MILTMGSTSDNEYVPPCVQDEIHYDTLTCIFREQANIAREES